MKKITIIAATLISMIACTKDGYMYKAYHAQHVPPNHYQGVDTLYATDFFYMEDKDDGAAWAWYQKTDAYKDLAPRSDSTWVEYHCTYEEWKKNHL